MNTNIYDALSHLVGKKNILLDEPMKIHTTFRVGGQADYFLKPKSTEDIAELIQHFHKNSVNYYILGNGSNLLVSDKGYRGAIIQIYQNMNNISTDSTTITVEAGALLSQVANKALEQSLTGLEFAAGIPGTAGGAAVMNAGAYGGEMKQVISSVKVITKEGEIKTLTSDELDFSYRSSIIKKKQYIVSEINFNLKKGTQEAIKEKMNELKKQRTDKQPLDYPSAGSTFKRPEGHFAGKLIMDAGLKGYQIGGAQISEKHCGFVINTGDATASDIYQLIQSVKEKIHEQFGVVLEPEVCILGEF